jgi:hypothetical protein
LGTSVVTAGHSDLNRSSSWFTYVLTVDDIFPRSPALTLQGCCGSRGSFKSHSLVRPIVGLGIAAFELSVEPCRLYATSDFEQRYCLLKSIVDSVTRYA